MSRHRTVRVRAQKRARAVLPTDRFNPKKSKTSKDNAIPEKLVPGRVAIVLAGKFAGKRVVVLKTLPASGFVVATGPFELNGVPIRRFKAHVLQPVSFKIDINGVDTQKFDDKYFIAVRDAKKLERRKLRSKATEDATKEVFVEQGVNVNASPDVTAHFEQRKKDSQPIDEAIKRKIKEAGGDDALEYLKVPFSLGHLPGRLFYHDLKF